MKKLFLLFLPAILLFAVSCGDDDDNEVDLKGHPIIGEWVTGADSYSYDIETGNTAADKEIKDILNGMPSIVGETATFNEDGTVESTYEGERERMEYSIRGSKLILKDDGEELTASYSILNNTLTIVFDLKSMIEKEYGVKIKKALVTMRMTRR